MRRLIISFLLLLAATPLLADNVVTLSAVEGRPGDVVNVSVSLQNTDEVTAVEVRIPLNDYLTYVDGSAQLNGSRSDGHAMSAGCRNNELRLYAYSNSLKPLKGKDGELFTFQLKLGKAADHFSLQPVVKLSRPNGQTVAATVQPLVADVLAPRLELLTTRLDFGHVPIRSTYTRTLQIRNTGTETLHVSGISYSAAEFSSEQTFEVQPGQTQNVTVNYAPTKRGVVSETLSMRSDAVNGVVKATLVADPFSVNELHVGDASGGSDEEVEIMLTMNNMEPIVAMQCDFQLPEQLVFVEGSFQTAERSSMQKSMAMVNGNTLRLVLYNTSNKAMTGVDGVIGSFRVRLNGKSGYYNLNPTRVVLSNSTQENMTSAYSQGRVQIQSPTISGNSSLNFVAMPVTEPLTATYTIRNSGQRDLVIDRIAFLDEGFSVKETLPLTIAKGNSKNITIQYVASQPGAFCTQMNIYSNDPTTRMKPVELSGSSYAPNTLSMHYTTANDNKHVSVSVAMDNYSPIVAAQMDVHCVAGMELTTADVELSSRAGGFSVAVARKNDTTYRILLYSLSNATIEGQTGDLFTMHFKTDQVAFNGTVLWLDEVRLGTSAGSNMLSKEALPRLTLLKRCAVSVESADEERGSVQLTGDEDGYVYYGTRVVMSAMPKEGWVFSGWSNGTAIVSTEPTYTFVVTEGCELTAQFIFFHPYRVTYYVDGDVYNSVLHEQGASIQPLASPVKEGHTFSGWSEIPQTMPAHDVDVYGTFTRNTYSITYMVDGEVYGKVSVGYGLVIPSIGNPQKKGYVFANWEGLPTTMPGHDIVVNAVFKVFDGVIPDVTYYIRNVETGRFIDAGNDWGTRVSLGHGMDIVLSEQSSGEFKLLTNVNFSSSSIGTNGYLDSKSVLEVKEAGDGYFTIGTGSSVLTASEGTTIVNYSAANGDWSRWQFMTEEDLLDMLQEAHAENPIDATWLIKDPNFGRCNLRFDTAWGEKDKPTKDGDMTNMNAAMNRSGEWTVQQTVSLPNGIYELSCQGFVGAAEPHAFLFANNEMTPLRIIADDEASTVLGGSLPSSQNDASAAFDKGLYRCSLSVEVTDGVLALGVKSVDAGSNWTAFDNFELTYYGPKASDFLLGDVNMDGMVDGLDAIGVLSIIKGKTEGLNVEAADVNQDGKVDGLDVLNIFEIIKKQ